MALIEVRNISRSYRMGAECVTALADVSLSIEAGSFVAVMGPSGSGKSTFMNLIGCLDRPDAGEYRLEGELVSTLPAAELARVRNRRIGFVFQQFNLLQRSSALANVELPMLYAGLTAHQRHTKALVALERVGLAERKNHRPMQLSGGQQQRVAIARALVNQPAVVLADEPTGALDSTTSMEIMTLFQELNAQGATVVVVTHEEDVARYAGRVIRFLDGRVKSDATQTPASAADDLSARLKAA